MNRGNQAADPTSVRSFIADRLGIDTRALGAFRISVGLLILATLSLRLRDVTAFYTDSGVLPRAALAELYPTQSFLSLHAYSGSVRFQAILIGVAAIFAIALLVGYRTTVAAAISWYLLVSLFARNPYVLNGGDTILVVCLFFALFLPLGERWSIDALRRGQPRHRVSNAASASVLLFTAMIYFSNGLLKLQSSIWLRGDAVRSILSMERYTVMLGPYIAQIPTLLVAINWAWMGLLLSSVLLIVLTGRWRAAVTTMFVIAQLGMFLTMRLGLFPLIMIAILLPFLPSGYWDVIEERIAAFGYLFVPSETTRDRLRRMSWDESADTRLDRAFERANRIAPAIVCGVLVMCLVWQASAIGVAPVPAQSTAVVSPGQNTWTMFAPNPSTRDGWFVVPAELDSGRQVDAFHRAEVTWDRPADVAQTYPSHLWHLYLSKIRYASDAERTYFAEYLCRRGVRFYNEPIENITIYSVDEYVKIDEESSANPTELYRHTCDSSAGGA